MTYLDLKTENDLSKKIIGCAIEVHKHLGPGLLESSYEACLTYELQKIGLKVERQKGLPIIYKEIELNVGYRIDLLIEDKVVVEIKSVEEFDDVHFAQILTYLKFSKKRLGILLNFKVVKLTHGIKRLVL